VVGPSLDSYLKTQVPPTISWAPPPLPRCFATAHFY